MPAGRLEVAWLKDGVILTDPMEISERSQRTSGFRCPRPWLRLRTQLSLSMLAGLTAVQISAPAEGSRFKTPGTAGDANPSSYRSGEGIGHGTHPVQRP